MSNNFITNSDASSLKARLGEIIEKSEELKFLVGFFYFSGLDALFDALQGWKGDDIKILVGLQVDRTIHGLHEYATEEKSSGQRMVENFLQETKKSLNGKEFDTKKFYEQIDFFIGLIKSEKLIIRKTLDPNHAKLYVFKLESGQIKKTLFITGSSNLTRAGLAGQNEFNVEISDYGYDDANEYFDVLWESAVRITEPPETREKLIRLLEEETHIKKITPYEAYVMVLKTYIDSYRHGDISKSLERQMTDKGYYPYKYQLDATKQALAIIEDYGGVIIADVVGLGKSVIASMVAKELGGRGIVICPPGLIGEESPRSGWHQYVEDFGLGGLGWKIYSRGDLEKAFGFVRDNNEVQTIIVDEAHGFRNQDTKDYELLSNICRGKRVILLSATPFNNSPYDLLSLVQLFIAPKKSPITLDDNIKDKFKAYNGEFNRLADIKKYHNSTDSLKRDRAHKYFQNIFGADTEFSLTLVQKRVKSLAREIRNTIEPITVRRNRLDLLGHPSYKNEVEQLSKVDKPKEWLYRLTPEQSRFYDEVIEKYFAPPDDGGRFRGAIYRPFAYEEWDESESTTDVNAEFERTSQRNLYDFMRRLIVKRFESSVGAFEKSLVRFIKVNNMVKDFIDKSGGRFILDRNLIEKIYTEDDDVIEDALNKYQETLEEKIEPRNEKIYEVDKFKRKEEFLADIDSDISMFKELLERIKELDFVGIDPKLNTLIHEMRKTTRQEPSRKIIVFSEYADTVNYISEKINVVFNNRALVVSGTLSKATLKKIRENFDAKSPILANDYDLLITTDRLSEGFNLNLAGMVINYDIPWNPVRVIQRVGRINRMSKKVFDKLFIINFFPTEQGADQVRSREIAEHKMFIIHNTLGEDSQIFNVDEEPTPSKLFERINEDPEKNEGESFYTLVVKELNSIEQRNPGLMKVISEYPARIKTAKKFKEESLIVFIKKGRLYAREYTDKTRDITLEDVIDKIRCLADEPREELSDGFWEKYNFIRSQRTAISLPVSEISLENKSLNNLKSLREREDLNSFHRFIESLIEDIKDFGTLSNRTLRRIISIKYQADIMDIADSLGALSRDLGGEEYLDDIRGKSQPSREIIIAIENQANDG